MAASVYVESSVVSYLVAKPSRDLITASRQAITVDWWQNQRSRFAVYVSALLIDQLGGDVDEE